jgi:hypothetical protein
MRGGGAKDSSDYYGFPQGVRHESALPNGYSHDSVTIAGGRVEFHYVSAQGTIPSDWTVKRTTAEWDVTIPANTVGWFSLSDAEVEKCKVEGELLAAGELAKAKTRGGQYGNGLAAGSCSFQVDLRKEAARMRVPWHLKNRCSRQEEWNDQRRIP